MGFFEKSITKSPFIVSTELELLSLKVNSPLPSWENWIISSFSKYSPRWPVIFILFVGEAFTDALNGIYDAGEEFIDDLNGI